MEEFGLAGNYNMVSGALSDIAALMHEQEVVFSNDTGSAHIAAAIPDAPPVIVPFSILDENIWMWSKNHYPVRLDSNERAKFRSRLLSGLNYFDIGISERSKVINRIKTDALVGQAEEFLQQPTEALHVA